jgi:hypothetical protein
MALIKARAPRWYKDNNGVVEACYQLPKKSGNGVKEPTLREAKELGLLPSVTTILNVMAKPGLERWKLEQAIHSALTLPRQKMEWDDWWAAAQFKCPMVPRDMMEWAYDHPPDYLEPEDSFAQRVAQDMEQQGLKAAEFGTRIHDAIAEYLTGKVVPRDLKLARYLDSFYNWGGKNIEEVHSVEQVVGGKRFGYAGRMDLDCTLKGVGRCVVDFKTQAVREGKEPTFYLDWGTQLAAYANTLPVPPIGYYAICSVVISSAAPGPVHVKEWHGWGQNLEMFKHCFELWKFQNDYDPTL